MGGLEIAIRRDGIHTFEALILARYQMNTQVYYHRLRRIYDLYLREYFKARSNGDLDTQQKVLEHNDVTMLAAIMRDADRLGAPSQPWAKRIRDRVHHRIVFESDEDTGATQVKRMKLAFERIQSENKGIDFRWDQAEVSIHKLLLPDDKDEKDFVQFYVIDRDGREDLIGERSPILRKIPRWFQVCRIFADLGRDQRPLLEVISDKCKEYARA